MPVLHAADNKSQKINSIQAPMSDLEIIILAAGKGTRMGGEKPKVLTDILGKPMISYILDSIEKVHDKKPLIVVGFQADKVKAAVGGARGRFVVQTEQKGTGHAVKEALVHIDPAAKYVWVIYGDHPLVSDKTIQSIYKSHAAQSGPLTLGTVKLPDFADWREGFHSFGRVVRDKNSRIKKIIEKLDATDAEQAIKEVSPSYFCFNADWLRAHINELGAANQKSEYYLTDLIEIAQREGHVLNSIDIPAHEALGVNTPEQLQTVLKFISPHKK